ncbi:MAG: hypothetical protein WCF85_17835 [Rhodospirillaceae bacterium]
MCPTPVRLSDDVLRVYITCLDESGRGHGGYVDVAADDPTRIMHVAAQPVLSPGQPGCFDDNGVMPLSVVKVGPAYYMYYAGFEMCQHIRYRIFSGLAISTDAGLTFQRCNRTPVLDRSDAELFFRCGPHVLHDHDRFRLWYVAGDSWTTVDEKAMPVYDLRYAESENGLDWPDQGRVSLPITEADEHGFGRPWVIKDDDGRYRLFYSIRRRSLRAYRLGYAESDNGIDWVRKDAELGLDVSPGSFDSDAIMYSAVIAAKGRTYCFYNGNGFGKGGFAVAELVT